MALYHSADVARGRGVFTLLMPAVSRCLVVVVNNVASAAREVNSSILERSWKEAMSAIRSQDHNTQDQVSGTHLPSPSSFRTPANSYQKSIKLFLRVNLIFLSRNDCSSAPATGVPLICKK